MDLLTPTPRLIDVARRAGVSPATVSRVLNRSGPVNPQTRERVQAAIAALGYVRVAAEPENDTENPPQGFSIAVFITDILNPVFAEFLRGVEDEIGSRPIAIQVHNLPEQVAPEKTLLGVLASHRVRGVIAFASHIREEELVAVHEQHGLPLVVVNRRMSHPDIPSIVVDFADATYRAAQHLLTLGHTRIGFLAGLGSAPTSAARREGIERALAERGLTLPDRWCVSCFPSIEGGFQAMSALLPLPAAERPSAVITYNDLLGFGALHAVRSHGLSVPEDMSVVGYDGIALAAHSNPPLTTIDQPKYRMGRLALQQLAKRIDQERAGGGGYTLMESPLIVRGSTAIYRQEAQ